MPKVPVVLADGHGSGHLAKINGEGELNVVVHPHPPRNEIDSPIPFREYFTDSSGSFDMKVDGSSDHRLFSIRAVKEYDIFVKTCSVLIGDAGAPLNEFGNIGSLTNGVHFEWATQDRGNSIIHEGLKTNFQFVRLSAGNPAFGTGNSAFRANNVSGSTEAFLPFIDLSMTFGLKWGVRIRKGTTDRLTFTIRDDLTGVDDFNIIAYGIKF